MKMYSLEKLTMSIMRNDVDRAQFGITYNKRTFSVIWIIDTNPYTLVLLRHGVPGFLKIKVQSDFWLSGKLDKDYNALCELLGIEKADDGRYHFPTSKFFEYLDRHTPTEYKPNNHISAERAIKYYDDIPDADKIYPCGIRNNPAYGTNVSEKNKRKVELLLGREAAQICEDLNLSICFTDDPDKAVKIDLNALKKRH